MTFCNKTGHEKQQEGPQDPSMNSVEQMENLKMPLKTFKIVLGEGGVQSKVSQVWCGQTVWHV